MSLLKERYKKEIVPALKESLSYGNVMEVPRLEKIVLNIGVGEATSNAKALEAAEGDLTTIAGQHPVTMRAKRSVANFKLREGTPIGLKVTLRGERMYQFLERLINAALPRIREFRGIPREGFDGSGNYNLGIKEQAVFPEIDFDKIDKVRGLSVSIVTTASTDEEGRHLLEMMGIPFPRD